MWESLFGSAVAPAVTQGVGEAAINSAMPALADTALQTGVDQALAGTLPNQLGNMSAGLGMDQTFQALGQAVPNGVGEAMVAPMAGNGFTNIAGLPIAESALKQAQQSMFGDWGDKAMNILGSDQFKNATALGIGGFNAMNQANAISDARKIQQEQLKMSKDAYNRDRQADDNRRKLVF